eukprot:GILK01008226.1.p1 GENE.GILK01008226.1~~GILK01008226.1.p1  ORF type:complete len:216 (-),score=10.14 GILK01008226.1:80-697(-)
MSSRRRQLSRWVTKKCARFVSPDHPFLAFRDTTVSPEERATARAASLRLQPGDIILVVTPSAFYNFFRNLTGNTYDHAVVVVDRQHVLHVGAPFVRLLTIDKFLIPRRKPLILRPRLTGDQRSEFLGHLKQLIHTPYNVFRAYSILLRIALRRHFGVRFVSGSAPSVDHSSSISNSNSYRYHNIRNGTYNWPASTKAFFHYGGAR